MHGNCLKTRVFLKLLLLLCTFPSLIFHDASGKACVRCGGLTAGTMGPPKHSADAPNASPLDFRQDN